jgi:hypothetical protein
VRKFKVEYTFISDPDDGPPRIVEEVAVVEAEYRGDALVAVLHRGKCRLIQRIRVVPLKPGTNENGTRIPDDVTCGDCGWLHENSPQFTSGLYDRDKGQPWCWAVPSHVHRSAKLPACAHWKPKEEGT